MRTTVFYDDPSFYVGGIVGQNGSWEYDGKGLVIGCTLEAGSRVGCGLYTSGDTYVGGIVGRSSAPVRDCSNLAGPRA